MSTTAARPSRRDLAPQPILDVEQLEQRRMIESIAPLGPIEGDDGHLACQFVTISDSSISPFAMFVGAWHRRTCLPCRDCVGRRTLRLQCPPTTKTTPSSDIGAVDPIRIRRAQIAKWTLLANRVGYLFGALAMALFLMAFVLGFNSTMATLVIISFIIGCVLLAPSIIIGYAVKAAEREDRENGL